MTGNKEFSSGGTGVLGEENNEESASNKEWDQKNGGNENVPPIIGFIKDAVEDLAEESNEEHKGDDTNGNNTALHWEATAAREVFGFLGRAVADAAAAEAFVNFILIELLLFWVFFFFRFVRHLFFIFALITHKWLLVSRSLVGH